MPDHFARNVLQTIAKAKEAGACWNFLTIYMHCQERELTHALFKLEQGKLIWSELVERGNGLVRVYHLTAEGEKRVGEVHGE